MSDPEQAIHSAYDADRRDGELILFPVAHTGPGRAARFSLALGLIFGLACLIGGLVIGYNMSERMANGAHSPPPWVGWIFPGGCFLYPLAILTFAGCTKLYRTLHRPLIVHAKGPARYGRKILVPESEIAGICVERLTQCISAESGPDYIRKYAHLYLQRTDGRYVELPAPYFSNLEGWELPESLGAALAATIGVPLSFEHPPPEHSTPQTNARRWISVFGTFAFIIGIPHWLAGFGLLTVRVAAAIEPAIRIPANAPPPWFAAIFFISGSLLLYIGCRCYGYGRGTWLRLIGILACLEVAALLAIRRFG